MPTPHPPLARALAAAPDTLDELLLHADHPSGFTAAVDAFGHYTSPDIPGVVAWQERGGCVFVFGGPFAPVEHRAALLEAFRADVVGKRRLSIIGVRAADLSLYADLPWRINQYANSYGIDLGRFTMAGKPLAKVRQNLHRATREGVVVEEVDSLDRLSSADAERLDEIDAAWLRSKGRFTRELSFVMGERGGRGAPYRRVFLARCHGEVVAYATFAPASGSQAGWYAELSRRLPESPVGTAEMVLHMALETFRAEGAAWLHLGIVPYLNLTAAPEPNRSPLIDWLHRDAARKNGGLYPAATQLQFKRKWAPHSIEPEYMVHLGRPSLRMLWHFMRISNAF